jgi:CRISPR-associated endonuclease Cas2
MPRKKKTLSFVEKMKKLQQSGLSENTSPNRLLNDCELKNLELRIKNILQIVDNPKKKPNTMIFFVMYDIESNKVRRHIVKYLEKKGCTRVQRSIFLADADTAIYNEIKNDLAEVQACYDNNDSILVVPISPDYLRAMKIIGQSIDLDIITRSKTSLFF